MTTLAENRIEWARKYMPVLSKLKELHEASKPFQGLRVAVCSHVEPKFAVLLETLADTGAEVVFAGCIKKTTQVEIVEYFEKNERITGFPYSLQGDSYNPIEAVLNTNPHILIDDGAELTTLAHHKYEKNLNHIMGACEQTTTGIAKLKELELDVGLLFPVYKVNDTPSKKFFDNAIGTAESVIAAISQITNVQIAGKIIVVIGFGYCGRGIAFKAKALGAKVIVTEISPLRALEAHSYGFDVMPLFEAIQKGELFITATGKPSILKPEHIAKMSDGAILANVGHSKDEIMLDKPLDENDYEVIYPIKIEENKTVYLLAGGHPVNLASPNATGNPIEIIDQTLALQYIAALNIAKPDNGLTPGIHELPEEIDTEIVQIKLDSMGINFDNE